MRARRSQFEGLPPKTPLGTVSEAGLNTPIRGDRLSPDGLRNRTGRSGVAFSSDHAYNAAHEEEYSQFVPTIYGISRCR